MRATTARIVGVIPPSRRIDDSSLMGIQCQSGQSTGRTDRRCARSVHNCWMPVQGSILRQGDDSERSYHHTASVTLPKTEAKPVNSCRRTLTSTGFVLECWVRVSGRTCSHMSTLALRPHEYQ